MNTFHLIFFAFLVSSLPQSETNNTLVSVIATLTQTLANVDLASTKLFALQNSLRPNLTRRDRCAFEDCLTLLDDTLSDLKTAVSKLRSSSFVSRDVSMLLSDAMTNQDTCLEGFTTGGNDRTYGLAESLKESILNITNNLGTSLDLIQKHFPETFEDVDVEFPRWVSENDKGLLQASVEETTFNLVVAQDGSGNFTTINAAVSAAPDWIETRFTICIKRGVYFENVEIPKTKTMLMFVGDGIGKTVIKAKRSYDDGWSTFQTATVGVQGKGFIAKGISFVNFAGPAKQQAVALRSGSEHSAFYRCAFEGYQDTLYVHSATQFYRECDIYGTVDFIFGNAAVVFQNCSLYARKPIFNQKIAFTAQSRNDSKQTTGISIINCRILAATDLILVKASFKAYLGRPWGLYSRTTIIKSFIDDLIEPAGWLEWQNQVAPETLFYGEYKNEGPGSNTTNRVKWPGYRRMETAMEATQFTVGPFIHGNTWLNSTGIPFNLGF